MKKIIVLIGIWVIELFAFFRWFGCWQFNDNFYFTSSKLSLTLLNATNAEKGLPIVLIRLLHNKLFGFLWGIFQTLLQYWDIRFLIEFLGIVGGIGVYFGLWYCMTQKRKNILLWYLIGLLTLFEGIELFFIPHFSYKYRMIPIVFLLQILSLFGIWQFLGRGKMMVRYSIIGVLILLSIVALILLPLSYQLFCLKV